MRWPARRVLRERARVSAPSDAAIGDAPPVKRDWPLLIALAMTGLTALALEVLWSRAMIPWVGGTALSQITTVGVYMAGLFLGSALAVPRLARTADPRRLFFRAEIGAALLSLGAVVGMPLADPLFAAFSRGELLGSGLGSVLRGLAGAGLMIPATVLMGLSFPMAIAAFERGLAGRGSAALAYGVNTLGATLGTLIGGFVLVPRLGVTNGALAVVGADFLLLVVLMRGRAPAAYHESVAHDRAAAPKPAPSKSAAPSVATPAAPAREGAMLLSLFLGGMVALGLQALLFRLLGLLLGPTARAFTVVLAVYVAGLGIGSLLVKRLVERGPRVAAIVYLLCWLVAGAYGLAVETRVEWLTGLVAAQRGEGVIDLAAHLRLRALIATIVLLPITIAFGASYSAAVGAAPVGDARRASRFYAALTLGNIVGLGVVAWGVLPNFRLDRALLLVLAGAFVTPLPALLSLPLPRLARVAVVPLAAALAAVAFVMPGWPLRVMHTAAYIPAYAESVPLHAKEVVRFHRSAFETSVTVVQVGEELSLQLDGKTTGSFDRDDLATQGLLGALPAALHPAPKDAFVIGLGTGQTPAEVLRFPVTSVDCAEISPEVVETMPLFAAINRRCDRDPRFRMLEADGRTVLRYGGKRYDLVVSEPSNVWIPGVAHLYTAESFRDVAGCLEPQHGLCVQWVQGYGLEVETIKTIVRTFLDVFPHASLWFSSFAQPDIFLLGSLQPVELDWDALEARLAAAQVPDTTLCGKPHDALSLLRRFVAGPDALRRFAGDGPRTTDARPSLEYAAEEALVSGESAPGSNLIAQLCEAPLELFPERGARLAPERRAALERRARANRELAAQLADTKRAAQLPTSAGLVKCKALIDRYPDDVELRYALVTTLVDALSIELVARGGNDPEILGLMARTATLEPDHPESLKFEALRRSPEGLAVSLKLLAAAAERLEPWRQSPRVDRAQMLRIFSRYSEAKAELEAVVARDAWNYSAWREMAELGRASGDGALAKRAAARMAELGDDGSSRESQRRLEREMEAIDAARAGTAGAGPESARGSGRSP